VARALADALALAILLARAAWRSAALGGAFFFAMCRAPFAADALAAGFFALAVRTGAAGAVLSAALASAVWADSFGETTPKAAAKANAPSARMPIFMM